MPPSWALRFYPAGDKACWSVHWQHRRSDALQPSEPPVQVHIHFIPEKEPSAAGTLQLMALVPASTRVSMGAPGAVGTSRARGCGPCSGDAGLDTTEPSPRKAPLLCSCCPAQHLLSISCKLLESKVGARDSRELGRRGPASAPARVCRAHPGTSETRQWRG